MEKNAVQFSEPSKNIGTPKNDTERDNAEATIIQGWERLVKTTVSKVIGEILIVCNRSAKSWDEEVKQAITVGKLPLAGLIVDDWLGMQKQALNRW